MASLDVSLRLGVVWVLLYFKSCNSNVVFFSFLQFLLAARENLIRLAASCLLWQHHTFIMACINHSIDITFCLADPSHTLHFAFGKVEVALTFAGSRNRKSIYAAVPINNVCIDSKNRIISLILAHIVCYISDLHEKLHHHIVWRNYLDFSEGSI